jgi:hypothetical protein
VTPLESLLHLPERQASTYSAGAYAPSGTYVDVDTGRIVRLDREGRLPASLDGRAAVYVAQPRTWGSRTRAKRVDR